MALLDFIDDDSSLDETIEPVPMTLPLDRKTKSWLAAMASDPEEAAEIVASIVRMVVEDDEAAHGETKH